MSYALPKIKERVTKISCVLPKISLDRQKNFRGKKPQRQLRQKGKASSAASIGSALVCATISLAATGTMVGVCGVPTTAPRIRIAPNTMRNLLHTRMVNAVPSLSKATRDGLMMRALRLPNIGCALVKMSYALPEIKARVTKISCALLKISCVVVKMSYALPEIKARLTKISCALLKISCALPKISCVLPMPRQKSSRGKKP